MMFIRLIIEKLILQILNYINQYLIFYSRMEHSLSFEISTEDSVEKNQYLDSAQHLADRLDQKTSMVLNQKTSMVLNQKILWRSKCKPPRNQKLNKPNKKLNNIQKENFIFPSNKNFEIPIKKKIRKRQEYSILNLTFTLYTASPSSLILKWLCFLAMVIRIYLVIYFLSVILMAAVIPVSRWYFLITWVVAVVGTRLVYITLVMRMGLTSTQNHLERILKKIWSKHHIRINQAFQYITFKKFKQCLINAIIPPELSFLYIPISIPKRILIYSVINYIYMSIQSIFMYPFAIVYSIYVIVAEIEGTVQFWKYTWITLVLTGIWTLMFLGLCGYLLYKGYKYKYQKLE